MEEALPIPTLTAAALEAMDTVRRYICSFNVDKNVINQLSKMDTIRLPGAVARCERCAILGTLCDVSSLHESGLSLIFGLLIFVRFASPGSS
ncbi:Large ribosomal subunit protein [Trichinella pseudospiralis]